MRRRLPDLAIIALLFALPLVMFWQQTVGGRTLLPAENLYQYEPFASYRAEAGAPDLPHNALVSDLILENYQWKWLIRHDLAQGEVPLWNPYQFAGLPFMASGQQSTLYPFSLIYYILPLSAAYGWFNIVQLGLAGVFMLLFARGLGISRVGGALAGIIYQLSAFFVISAVFPMIVAAAVWLPLILLMIEFVIQRRPALRDRAASIPWVAIGAVAVGCCVLAGHVEILYYTLLISAYYAAVRLIVGAWRRRHQGGLGWLAARAGWLIAMMALGLALGAVQFLPLFELASRNFRSGSVSLIQVLGWAHPMRDFVQFLMPNFYGSPAHHAVYDLFSGQWQSIHFVNGLGQTVTNTSWGIKNYVEGALYLGVLPLALALFALIDSILSRRAPERLQAAPYRVLFVALALLSLSFMFGFQSYALLFALPGIDQLHSPFRWVFALTLSVAVLAGFGLDAIARADRRGWARGFGVVLTALGGAGLVGLLLTRLFYERVAPIVERVFNGMALANTAFPDAQTFYSYEAVNAAIFLAVTLGAGIVILLARRRTTVRGLPLWAAGAMALVAADLMIASWGFNPASDPKLLDYTPPALAWLQQQPGAWRYTTLDDPTQPPILNANLGMSYGLDDVRGYESIIPRQYVDFMQQLTRQTQLDYNRVAPLYSNEQQALESPLLDLLNVRYVVTAASTAITQPDWSQVYADKAVRIYQKAASRDLPRAYTVAAATFDPAALVVPTAFTPAAIRSDSGRELLIDAQTEGSTWLIVSQSNFPGWRAFVRPQGGTDRDEQPADVQLVQGNFQGVPLPQAGDWTIRLVYSPQSIQIGGFISFIGGVIIIFLLGLWLWRLFVSVGDEASATSRVAKNSLAPIALNLFNRGIDFAFAFVMLRVLGPDGAGIYYYAIIIFGWFDIFTNFGLNLFLTREVARDRSHAGRYLWNTSALRLLLAVAGVPLLLAFLGFRQSTVSAPLSFEALAAIALLYIGLVPNSLSTGLSALFYGFEQAEIPAAIATVATICKAVFGLAALAEGYGVIGLAAVSILTNLITLAIMSYCARGLLKTPEPRTGSLLEGRLIRSMVGESWPLMLNHFLASIFFQIDVILIEAMHGDVMVGQYSVAYKWVLALNIIPSFFTQAMLPVMSRQAHADRVGFKQTYALAIKLLLILALPTAVLFTFMAYPLTGLLGGSEFLPDGAIALQFMIWSIPIGWMNSLTQYVLIALDLQRRITTAFILGVSFNLIMNFIFIPTYGYRAAALITIASEAVLFVPFALLLKGAMGGLDWVGMIWKPLAALAAMIALTAVGWSIQPVAALVAGIVVYPVVLLALRPFSAGEWARLMPLLPARLRRVTSVT